MSHKDEILLKLKEIKPTYAQEGLEILGVFGSYAKETQTQFSDIDIAYKLDYDKFSLKYKDGFAKLLRIEDIKKELQNIFHTPIDLVPSTNQSILKDLIYVADNHIIEDVVRYNLPIFKKTIGNILEEEID